MEAAMRLVYQSGYSTTVRREGDELLAESFLLSSYMEAVASLRVDVSGFRVRHAQWEIYRSPGGSLNGGRVLPQVNGIETYFKEAGRLLRAAKEDGGEVPRELFNECVNGIIQAETFLYYERGFGSPREYEEFWEKSFTDSCRYYKHLERTTQTWCGFVGDLNRQGRLFDRYKSCQVFQTMDGTMVANGSFVDSFHELGVSMLLDAEGLITAVSGNFIRPPDQVCVESEKYLASLPGRFVGGLSRKDVAALIGGAEGCVHLMDIVNEVRKAAAAALEEQRRDAAPLQ
jgi:hypothetical protein